MLRTFSLLAITAASLLFPSGLTAGGPPRLCLPIDGVTLENAKTCADLITAGLGSKLDSNFPEIRIQQHSNQWCVTLYLGRSVNLSDIEAAFKGSGFSVPRDRLRLFGHVILEIDAREASVKDLLASLKALPNVAVDESKDQEDRLLVTVDMPYPVDDGRDRDTVGWTTFRRSDLSNNSDRTPTTARKLPSLNDFRDDLSKHSALLKDVRWSNTFACRTVGCVVAPKSSDTITSPQGKALIGKWQVEFTNGVTEICDINSSGEATVTESQRGSQGTLEVKERSVVVTFTDDRVERWTPVGKRFVVEHWFPGSQFPNAAPIIGIAERTP